MPGQTLVGASVERSLTTEHGREKYRYARAIELEPMKPALVVKREPVIKVLAYDAARARVRHDNNGRAYFLERLKKNIKLITT